MLIMGQSNGNFMIKDILFVFGGESTAVEIRETVDRYCSYRKVYNILPDDKSKNDKSLNDRDILSFSELEYVCYIMGFTNVNLKKRIRERMSLLGIPEVNIIHPTAFLSKSSSIGNGNYIAQNVVISSNVKIGNSNIININASIGHDSVIGTDNTINPGVKISGNVTIGDRNLIGANTVLFQGISICNDCLIDALTYLQINIDIPSMISGTSNLKCYKRRFI